MHYETKDQKKIVGFLIKDESINLPTKSRLQYGCWRWVPATELVDSSAITNFTTGDFDDGGWRRQRRPLLIGQGGCESVDGVSLWGQMSSLSPFCSFWFSFWGQMGSFWFSTFFNKGKMVSTCPFKDTPVHR